MPKYDVVIFGATGYTGQFVVEYLAKAVQDKSKEDNSGVTWAVSARSEAKLDKVLAQASKNNGYDLINTPKIIADVSDEASLAAMARQAGVVLNCVGPYRFFGEQVVRACVKEGAHHLDISGEPQYMEKVQLSYHDEAAARGVYVVSACGFDSIPADVGQIFLSDKMEGDVNSIEGYLKVTTPENVSGPSINFATFQSAIYGFAHAKELKGIRKQLFPEKLPKELTPKLKPRGNLHFSEEVSNWCLPFPGSDRSVMMRTQRALYANEERRPTQIGVYARFSSLFYAVMTILCGILFGVLASFKFGRKLLEDYPGVFSMGNVTKAGPSDEMTKDTNFHWVLVGHGWNKRSSLVGNFKHDSAPNRRVKVEVKGKNVGYGSTCECIVQAALCVLKEKDSMPGVGGVYPPGYAFAKTTLVERLNRNGVTFDAEVTDI